MPGKRQFSMRPNTVSVVVVVGAILGVSWIFIYRDRLTGGQGPGLECPVCTDRRASHVLENPVPQAEIQWQEFTESLPTDMKGTLGKWLLTWQSEIRNEFDSLVSEGVTMEDPRLITHLRKVILPPTTHSVIKFSIMARETPQIKEIQKILKNKRNGFYIECGAFDGERSSNSLYLETKYGWSGLLVEMDPYFFLQIIGRSRKAYALNGCLSTDTKPSYMTFKESTGGHGKLSSQGVRIPCYPIYSVLQAINVTDVDFFSLDVEGAELSILKTMPHDKLNIKSWAIETTHGEGGKPKYKAYMESLGYKTVKDVYHNEPAIALYADDTIFVKP